MCVRKCFCNNCSYCHDRSRYEKNKETFLQRSKLQHLHERHLREDSYRVLDAFIDKRLSLQELELVLDVN